jgi:putative zinc finger/helix-turn-helix YgiT family protein
MTVPAAVACAACGASELEEVRERRQVVADDGTSLAFDDEFTRCLKCGVEFYTRDQSLAASRARAAVLRAHEGLLSPQEIRAIRDHLGYTQAQLEKVLGVGPKTVVRWEKGTVRQSRLADRFLRTLATNPTVVYETALSAMASSFVSTAAMRTAWGYVPAMPPSRWVGAHVSNVDLSEGIRVYVSTPMFIAGEELQAGAVEVVAGTVQLDRPADEVGWQLDPSAANSEMAEAA